VSRVTASSTLLANFDNALGSIFITSGGHLKFFELKGQQLDDIHKQIHNLYLAEINKLLSSCNLGEICKAVVFSFHRDAALPHDVVSQRETPCNPSRIFSVVVQIQLNDIEPAAFLDIPLKFYYQHQHQPTQLVDGYRFSHCFLDHHDNFLVLLLSKPLKKEELRRYLIDKVLECAVRSALPAIKDVFTVAIQRIGNALAAEAPAAASKTPPNVSLRRSPAPIASKSSTQTRATPPKPAANVVRPEETPNHVTTQAHVTSLDDLISAETARLKKMSLSTGRAQVQLGRTIAYTKDSLDLTVDDLPFPSFNRITVSEATLLYRYNKKYKLEKPVESMLDLYRDAKVRHQTRDRFYSEFLKDALTQLSIERRCLFTAADIIALHNNNAIPRNFSFVVKNDEEARALFRSKQFVNYDGVESKLGVKEQIALLSRIDLQHTKQRVSLPDDIKLYALVEATKFCQQPSNKTLKKTLQSAKKALDESEGEMCFKDGKNITYHLNRKVAKGSKLSLTLNNEAHNFNYSDIYSLWLNIRMLFDPTTKSMGLLDRIKNTVLRYLGGGFFFNKLEKDYPCPEENLSQIIHYVKNNPESLLAKSFRLAIEITIREKAQYERDCRRTREVSEAPSVAATVATQDAVATLKSESSSVGNSHSSTVSARETPAAAAATQHVVANISQTTVSPPEMPLARVSPAMTQSPDTTPVDQKTIFVAKREDEITNILINLRDALSSSDELTFESIDKAIRELENQRITPGQKNLYILGSDAVPGILAHLNAMSKRFIGKNKQSVDRWISFFERVETSVPVAQNRGTGSSANRTLKDAGDFLATSIFGRATKNPAAAAAPLGSLHPKH
jgi:hypothetical protein